MKKENRIIILDEMIDSCRLMPNGIQTVLFMLLYVMIHSILFWVHYFFYLIIIIQTIFIILLVGKNIVYRRISKIENAIRLKILWIHTKGDERDKGRKRLINFMLIGVAIILYFYLTDIKSLLINGLFCLLYLMKIIFYVPVLNLRILDDGRFQIINEKKQERFESSLYGIKKISIHHNKIEVETQNEVTDIEINFSSDKERSRMFTFLSRLNHFEVKRRRW